MIRDDLMIQNNRNKIAQTNINADLFDMLHGAVINGRIFQTKRLAPIASRRFKEGDNELINFMRHEYKDIEKMKAMVNPYR